MKRALGLLSLVASLLAGGCAWRRTPVSPMRFETFHTLGPARARGVLVLLPGFGDFPKHFQEKGFVRVLRERAPEYDIVAADAHFAYYRNRTVVQELHDHVIGPLLARGYRELWLLGTSMGGHGAVAYAREYPERVAGLLLFAPYFGPSGVVEEVEEAGGLCKWTPPREFSEDGKGFAQANFAWLKRAACQRPPAVAFWLGVGDSDRLLEADRLLGDVIEPHRFVVLPGGHGWEVWTPALERIAPQAFPPPARATAAAPAP